MAKVLVVGDIYLEMQFLHKEIPSTNTVGIADKASVIYGSKTINAARILARLGNEVDFFGKVGDDNFGKQGIEFLKTKKINTENVSIAKNSRTGQIAVLTNDNGESSISLFFGANKSVSSDDIEALENKLKTYDLIYAATNLALEPLYSLVETCRRNTIELFIDFPNQHKVIDLNKLSDCTFIAPNREEAQLILDTSINSIDDAFKATKQLRKFCNGTLIISLDKDGAVLLESNSSNPIHIPVVARVPKDSTAAGDIMRAVFVNEYLKTRDIKSALEKSTLKASESVEIPGVDNTIETLKLS